MFDKTSTESIGRVVRVFGLPKETNLYSKNYATDFNRISFKPSTTI